MRGKRLAALALAVAAAAALAGGVGRGDDTGVIVGRVFDRDLGSPLPFAVVMVRTDPPRWGTRVDPEGRFLIPQVPGGSWELEARALGYEPVAGAAPVGAGETTEVSFALAPTSDLARHAAARSGPEAPFLAAFPRSAELAGDGLLDAWYSGEFPRGIGFTADGGRLALATRSGLTVFRQGDVRLVPEHVLAFPPLDSDGIGSDLGPEGLVRVERRDDSLQVAFEADAWLERHPVYRLSDASTGEREWRFASPDRRLVAVRAPGSFRLEAWSLPEGRRIGSVRPALVVACAGFVPGGELFLVGGRGTSHTVEVWDLAARRLRAVLPAREARDPVRSLAVSPRGDFFVAGDARHALACWGLPDLRLRWRLAPRACCAGGFLELSPDGSVVVTGAGSGLLFVDATTGRVLREATTNHKRGLLAAAFRPDGKALATIGYDSMIGLWDLKRLLALRP
jgi:hypothetical protein